MAVSDPDGGMHAAFRGLLPEQIIVDLPADEASDGRVRGACSRSMPTRLPAIIVEPLVQGAGGMRFHDAAGAAHAARRGGPLRPAADLR